MLFLRARLIPLLVALSVMLLSNVALASHFRFGTITWTIPDPVAAPRTVRFVVTHGWARGSESSVTLNFGDSTTFSGMGTSIGTGTDVAGAQYNTLQFTTTHTYAASAGNGPFTVFFASCCRISGLTNGGDANFRVQTVVSLLPGNTGGPVTTAPAIISLSAGAVRTYLFPAFDPDFDPLTCRLGVMSESGLPTGQDIPSVPAGGAQPTVAATTGGCLLTWDLTRAVSGQRYVLPLVIESTHSGVRSGAPLDIIVEISNRPSPTCAGGGTFVAPVGQPFSATVTGTNPVAGNLVMTGIGVPSGATLNPVDGTSRASPYTTTFAWTPTMAFFGTTQNVLINYRNTDGLTGTCFLTIQVPTCNNFGTPCTVGVGACQRMGMNVCTGPGMTACNVTAGMAGTETCNGIDDDCDGMTDEGSLCTGTTPICSNTLRRCVQCATNANCPSTAPICEVAMGVCRACNMDSECSGATPACIAGRGCVQCTASNTRACTGATPVCNTTTNTCVQCNSNTDCSGRTPICNTTTRTCVPCTADSQCGGATPACATSGANQGACVQCTTANASVCTASMTVCDNTNNRCVRCNTNADCGGTTPACVMNTCRACRGDSDCGGATPACGASGACVQCTMTNSSACTGATSACNTTSNRCVQCTSNAQCGGTTPVCDLPSNMCRPCQADRDCSGATPACGATGACVQCTMTNATACTGMTPVCNTSNSTCVQCNTNAQCGGNTPICDMTSRRCRGCGGDTECGGATPACGAAGACVQCTAMSAGACRSPTSVCNPATSSCVQCLNDAQCSGNTPVCQGNMCRGCRNDMECAMRDGATACAATGACVQCTAMNVRGCPSASPVCNPTDNRCVLCTAGPMGDATRCAMNPDGRACIAPMMSGDSFACGCLADSDCGDSNSGRVCDSMTRRCVVGCAVGMGRNGCPMGQSCTADEPGAIGMCTTTCNRNADCMGSAPYCRIGNRDAGGMSACVECLNDSHCGMRTDGRALCDTSSSRCVQCTESNTASCMASGAGSACLMGVCGCMRDADCGGPASGRVCDTDNRQCRAGCAVGEGRNGCPSGLSCTSDDPNTIGMCTSTCNRNADCMTPTPYCRTAGGSASACVECLENMHCASRSDGRVLCDAVAAACVQCTDSDRTMCSATGAGSACVMGLCGCAADSDCGDATSGRVCDMSSRRCVAGCSAGSGRNGCPMGQSCTADAPGEVGMCTTTCNRNADCMAPRAVCLRPMGGGMSLCVECGADADCASRTDGRTRCDAATNACVQCTTANREMCAGSGAGSACLSNGTCGCAGDVDCASDRRCDTATNRCEPRPAVVDAGVADAGTNTMDGGPPATNEFAGGGCACHVGAAPTSSLSARGVAPWALVGLLGFARRRRSRRAA